MKAIDPHTLGLCYLGSPYTRFKPSIGAAFAETARIAARLLRLKVAVFSPIVHCHPLSTFGRIDPLDHSIWLPFNEPFLRVCDTLLVAHMEGWEDSYGIKIEIEFFEKANKPIYDLDPATLMMTRRKSADTQSQSAPALYSTQTVLEKGALSS